MSSLRLLLLKALYPVIVFFGHLHAPWTRKKISGVHYLDLMKKIEDGDTLVGRTEGEGANLIIPGYWKHVAMYIGNGLIVEAVGSGVRKSDLITFLLHRDHVKCLRPKFMTEASCAASALIATSQIGKPYDYELKSDIRAFYCAELCQWAYAQAMRPNDCPFKMYDRMGELTIAPDDFDKAKDKFSCEWDSDEIVIEH